MAMAEDGSGELLMPSYYQCTVEVYSTAVDQYHHLHTNYSHVQDLIRNISYYSKVSTHDIFWAICLATVLTLARYILTATLFTVSHSDEERVSGTVKECYVRCTIECSAYYIYCLNYV